MQKDKDSKFIMEYLDEAFQDKLPLNEVTPYELGILIGQRLLINKLKLKLEYTENERMEDK